MLHPELAFRQTHVSISDMIGDLYTKSKTMLGLRFFLHRNLATLTFICNFFFKNKISNTQRYPFIGCLRNGDVMISELPGSRHVCDKNRYKYSWGESHDPGVMELTLWDRVTLYLPTHLILELTLVKGPVLTVRLPRDSPWIRGEWRSFSATEISLFSTWYLWSPVCLPTVLSVASLWWLCANYLSSDSRESLSSWWSVVPSDTSQICQCKLNVSIFI